jgi:hypothetical protein
VDGEIMMDTMFGTMWDWVGGMMVGMGLVWLLVLAVLLLGAAALVKYLFSNRRNSR